MVAGAAAGAGARGAALKIPRAADNRAAVLTVMNDTTAQRYVLAVCRPCLTSVADAENTPAFNLQKRATSIDAARFLRTCKKI